MFPEVKQGFFLTEEKSPKRNSSKKPIPKGHIHYFLEEFTHL
jgi:hypothetical protein